MNFDALRNYLDSIPSFGAPGVDCIVKKEGETVFRHFAGLSDREAGKAMNGKERFYLYSASKVITCTAALQLYEKGRFLLTDPVAEYLPEFADMDLLVHLTNGTPELRKARTPITIGHLFSMSAGLDYDLNTPAIRKAVSENPLASTRELVRAIADRPLLYEPGTQYKYSLAHDVLGALIELLSGKRFGTYLKENIFDPVGMTHTGFAHGEDVKAEMMAQYRLNGETGRVERIPLDNEFILSPAYESGGAGLISSVEDYGKFADAMANGGRAQDGTRILSQATIDLMRTARIRPEQLSIGPHFAGYGYGLGVRTLVDKAVAGSNGPLGEFGWDGAAGCYVLIDPTTHISLFYAQQMRNGLGYKIHPRLRNMLYASL